MENWKRKKGKLNKIDIETHGTNPQTVANSGFSPRRFEKNNKNASPQKSNLGCSGAF